MLLNKVTTKCKYICMIKKEKDLEYFSSETFGYSHEQLHIELIERPHILGTLWNWSEDWKSSQVRSSFVLNFTTSRYALCSLFIKLRHCMLSHMNEVDTFIFRCVFLYKVQNCIFHVFFQQLVSEWSSISCLHNMLSES